MCGLQKARKRKRTRQEILSAQVSMTIWDRRRSLPETVASVQTENEKEPNLLSILFGVFQIYHQEWMTVECHNHPESVWRHPVAWQYTCVRPWMKWCADCVGNIVAVEGRLYWKRQRGPAPFNDQPSMLAIKASLAIAVPWKTMKSICADMLLTHSVMVSVCPTGCAPWGFQLPNINITGLLFCIWNFLSRGRQAS